MAKCSAEMKIESAADTGGWKSGEKGFKGPLNPKQPTNLEGYPAPSHHPIALVPGRPTIWITVGQGPTVLAVGAGGGCLDIFTLVCPFFPLSPSFWETARYRLKDCLKGPLNQRQLTNQPHSLLRTHNMRLQNKV